MIERQIVQVCVRKAKVPQVVTGAKRQKQQQCFGVGLRLEWKILFLPDFEDQLWSDGLVSY